MATQRRHDIKASVELVEKLDALKTPLGTTSRPSTIRRLVSFYEDSAKNRTKGELPKASPAIMADSTPCIIAGPSGAGKTRTIKALLPKESPTFILDISAEYSAFGKVGLGEFFAFDWGKGGRIRYVPSNALSATAEGESVLMQVAIHLRDPSKPLASWVIVVEEGDRFIRNPNLRTLLGEGRKFTAKVLVALQKWNTFKDVAPVYLPASPGDLA